jgi:hypothetical protein
VTRPILTLGLFAALLPGQSSHSATYDTERRVHLEGAVTRIDWVNPHAFLFIDARGAGGEVVNWAVEIGEPLVLERQGWSRNSLRIGEVVTMEGNPARGQKRQAYAESVTRGGQRIFNIRQEASSVPAGAVPRWPDGKVRLGPAPGTKGYWGTANVSDLFENSAQNRSTLIPMNRDGLLVNLSDADRVAPLQPWAKAIYEFRQRNLLKDDPYNRCVPPGGPRQFLMPNGFQFIEQPELGRILILLGGGNRNWRMIYTDGRPASLASEAVLTYYGNSVGHWEGDTLVVDSAGYNEGFWFSKGGLPHTEALHLIERFTRSDLGTLRYEVTIDDPRAYTRNWTGAWTMQWVSGQEIQEYFCEENAESTFIR